MDIIYMDESIIVCIKPAGVLSTDEPGGLPELLRCELGDTSADVRTVHRLDRAVSGVMLLARSRKSAGELSRQIREGSFEKRYLAAVHGAAEDRGLMEDLMYRDKARKMSFVTDTPARGVQQARLSYETLDRAGATSLVRVTLHTGRTHQIRCQFASRGLPLIGERKYSSLPDDCPLALWSYSLSFQHPATGAPLRFQQAPPRQYPWTLYNQIINY